MKSFDEAGEIIFKYISQIKKETELVELCESTGRILAEDVYSDVNLPPFDNSAMDGFAIKFSSEQRNWYIIDELTAGNYHTVKVAENQAVSIMTGAKLPQNADSVIPIENCLINGDKFSVSEDYEIKKGMNTRLCGEDLLAGSLALRKDTIIKSKNIHLIAACGKDKILVYKKLRIGLIACGDELVEVDCKPENDQIRSSNLAALRSAIRTLNMEAIDYGIVKDKPELIREKLLQSLESDIELLITCGGVSVGKYDFIQDVLKEIGAEIIFWRVNIKPGKPLLFSIYRKDNNYIPIISLPGNPVSSYLGFRLFVEPAIMNHFGINIRNLFIAKSRIALKKKDSKKHFVLGVSHFNEEDMCYEVESAGIQSSGALTSLSKADCLIVFPEGKNLVENGEWVECIRI